MSSSTFRSDNTRQQSDLFKLLVDNIYDYAVFALGTDGRILTWNKGAEVIHGFEQNEAIGQHYSSLFNEQDMHAGKADSQLQAAVKQERFAEECWLIRKNGSLFWALILINRMMDDGGKLRGFAVVVQDLTKAVHQTESLRRVEQAFRQLVATIKDYGIFLMDPEGRILTWNAGAQRMKGYTEEEIIGQHFSKFYLPDAIASNHPQYELEMAKQHGHYEEEGWRVKKDGSTFWASVTITPVYNQTGELHGFIKVTRDLTEKRNYELELQQARDAAIEANKVKSQFVANISHEVRTPLAGVIGMAEVLKLDETLDEDQREAADHIFSSSHRLLSVLNDLLDFSKLEAGYFEVENVQFSPRVLVDEVSRSVAAAAEKKGLQIIVDVADNVPQSVKGDDAKIRQTLMNLAHNAEKFTRKGSITISVSAENEEAETIWLRFKVIDTGIGIKPEVRPRLFEPFVQADGSTRRRFGGTGLGLSIAKRFIEMIGGNIGVESDGETGSTFWFAVPVQKVSV